MIQQLVVAHVRGSDLDDGPGPAELTRVVAEKTDDYGLRRRDGLAFYLPERDDQVEVEAVQPRRRDHTSTSRFRAATPVSTGHASFDALQARMRAGCSDRSGRQEVIPLKDGWPRGWVHPPRPAVRA